MAAKFEITSVIKRGRYGSSSGPNSETVAVSEAYTTKSNVKNGFDRRLEKT